MDVEVWSRNSYELGESPVWDSRRSSLWWVDILKGCLYTAKDGQSDSLVLSLGRSIGAVGLCRDLNKLILATAAGIEMLELSSGRHRILAPVEENLIDNRMNDAKVDARGTFWAGTTDMTGKRERGALYNYSRQHGLTLQKKNVSTSNGMGWSVDGQRMYYIDSPTRQVTVTTLDPDGERKSDERLFVDTREFAGVPDGLCVDAEGSVWICFWGGQFIRRFSSEGQLIVEVPLPVSHPTSCTFGGAGLSELLITTASLGLTSRELRDQPHAGKILRLVPGVSGCATDLFDS